MLPQGRVTNTVMGALALLSGFLPELTTSFGTYTDKVSRWAAIGLALLTQVQRILPAKK